MPGSFDCGGVGSHFREARIRLIGARAATRHENANMKTRPSKARPTDTPDLRFDRHLAMVTAKLGAKMDSLLLSYDSFIRYNMPVYPGAPRDTPVTAVNC